ncbi:keratin, type II cytoskeletal I-like [Gossypium hirsutum]|uniref:Keratin, type II cytoskeletal I-like n=1 Tax=Gossypium hirsutum TaxID=3635 RepID=A0ABM2ZDC8_GOSHI|nr:keratin, type II cytoskeletal I-like [Gossypium hirsutum]
MEGVAVNPIVTLGYNKWQRRRVNDNILRPNLEDARLIEEYLRVVPSELEIIRQDFEKKSSELEKKMKRLEEENVYLKLDVDVQKSKAENLRKGKRKRQEIQEEKAKTDQWKKKFHDTKAREAGLEKSLDDSQSEKKVLRARVAELEKVLHQHRSRNSVIELKASLSKIEDLKRKVEELKSTLQNCELQIERLEANNCQLSEQLHRSQDQVRDRDYLMGQAIAQIREVADYLQTLVVQADVLSTKYELVSDRGQELASLLRKVKVLSIRAKPYM